LSDGLRRELTIYGIRVAVVEPGLVQTPMWGKRAGKQISSSEDAPRTMYADTDYAAFFPGHSEKAADAHSQALSTAIPVETVSAAVWDALTADAPRTRYMMPEGACGGPSWHSLHGSAMASLRNHEAHRTQSLRSRLSSRRTMPGAEDERS